MNFILCGNRQEHRQVEKGKNFYEFQFNTRLVTSTIVHFQVEILYLLIDCHKILYLYVKDGSFFKFKSS